MKCKHYVRIGFYAMFALAICISTGNLSFARPAKVIKIGAAVSLSGRFAREGQFLKEGYEYWADAVNAEGGVKVGGQKLKVKIFYYDDESSPGTSAKLTQKLISDDKVDFLFGPYSSGIAIATAAISEKYHTISMLPMATANKIYQRGYRYVFCPSPLASTGLYPILNLIETLHHKPSTIAIVGPDSLFPNLVSAAAVKRARLLGLKVVYTGKFPINAPDLSNVAEELKYKNPDVILNTGYVQDSLLLIKSLRALEVNPKMIGLATTVAVPDFINSLGSAANQILGVDYWVPTLTYTGPVVKSSAGYYKNFKKKYNTAPTYQAASGTAAGIILQMAIESAQSLKTEKVRKALLNLKGETFYGKVQFNQEGVNEDATLEVSQIQDGHPVVIFPVEVRQDPVQYPRAAWKK